MVREAKRKDLEYKRHATVELAKFLTAFASVNLIEPVKEVVEDGIEELNEEDESDLQMKPVYTSIASMLIVGDFCFDQICML